MNKMTTLTTLSILCALSFAACGGASDETGEKSATAEDAIVYDTIVSRTPDGAFDVRQVPITLRARRAQEIARDAIANRASGAAASNGENVESTSEALTVDATCSGTDFWGYDGPSQSGNRICLHESAPVGATTALASFCKTSVVSCQPDTGCHTVCLATWKDHVQSWWAGAKEGWIGGPGWGQYVSPWTKGTPFLTTTETLQLQCVGNINLPCDG